MPKGQTRDKVMAAATETVNVVKCQGCGAMHLVDSQDFVVIYGNISTGMSRMIIDGNIDDKGKVSGSVIYCRTEGCLGDMLGMMLGGKE